MLGLFHFWICMTSTFCWVYITECLSYCFFFSWKQTFIDKTLECIHRSMELHLGLLGGFIVFITAIMAVINRNTTTGGLVGVALSYALQVILCSLPPYCLTPGGTLTHISHDPHCVGTNSGPLLTQVQHTKYSATDLVWPTLQVMLECSHVTLQGWTASPEVSPECYLVLNGYKWGGRFNLIKYIALSTCF